MEVQSTGSIASARADRSSRVRKVASTPPTLPVPETRTAAEDTTPKTGVELVIREGPEGYLNHPGGSELPGIQSACTMNYAVDDPFRVMAGVTSSSWGRGFVGGTGKQA